MATDSVIHISGFFSPLTTIEVSVAPMGDPHPATILDGLFVACGEEEAVNLVVLARVQLLTMIKL